MYTPKHLKRWTRPDCYIGASWPEYYSAGIGHWLADEPVWIYGRMDFGQLANYGSTISEALYESLRCG